MERDVAEGQSRADAMEVIAGELEARTVTA
jgi:hypothetical protein